MLNNHNCSIGMSVFSLRVHCTLLLCFIVLQSPYLNESNPNLKTNGQISTFSIIK